MNFRELGELVDWMKEQGVIHVSMDGVTLTLAEVPPLVYAAPEDEPDSDDDAEPDDGFTTPQARIRARLQKRNAEGNSTER